MKIITHKSILYKRIHESANVTLISEKIQHFFQKVKFK